jgi:hypothetical protein
MSTLNRFNETGVYEPRPRNPYLNDPRLPTFVTVRGAHRSSCHRSTSEQEYAERAAYSTPKRPRMLRNDWQFRDPLEIWILPVLPADVRVRWEVWSFGLETVGVVHNRSCDPKEMVRLREPSMSSFRSSKGQINLRCGHERISVACDCTYYSYSRMTEAQALHPQVRYTPCVEQLVPGFGLGIESTFPDEYDSRGWERRHLCRELALLMGRALRVYNAAVRVRVERV